MSRSPQELDALLTRLVQSGKIDLTYEIGALSVAEKQSLYEQTIVELEKRELQEWFATAKHIFTQLGRESWFDVDISNMSLEEGYALRDRLVKEHKLEEIWKALGLI